MVVIITNLAVSWKSRVMHSQTKTAFMSLSEEKNLNQYFKINYYSNFAVYRYLENVYVYVIFYGGHVNCTGIRNEIALRDAISVFKIHFSRNISSLQIHAIAATFKARKGFNPLNIQQIRSLVPSSDKVLIVRNYFSGLLIRFKEGGTAQLFYSGRVNFLGVKHINKLKSMWTVILRIINNVS